MHANVEWYKPRLSAVFLALISSFILFRSAMPKETVRELKFRKELYCQGVWLYLHGSMGSGNQAKLLAVSDFSDDQAWLLDTIGYCHKRLKRNQPHAAARVLKRAESYIEARADKGQFAPILLAQLAYLRGQCAEKMGKSNAHKFYEKAASLDSCVLGERARLALVRIYLSSGKKDKAEELIKTLKANDLKLDQKSAQYLEQVIAEHKLNL